MDRHSFARLSAADAKTQTLDEQPSKRRRASAETGATVANQRISASARRASAYWYSRCIATSRIIFETTPCHGLSIGGQIVGRSVPHAARPARSACSRGVVRGESARYRDPERRAEVKCNHVLP